MMNWRSGVVILAALAILAYDVGAAEETQTLAPEAALDIFRQVTAPNPAQCLEDQERIFCVAVDFHLYDAPHRWGYVDMLAKNSKDQWRVTDRTLLFNSGYTVDIFLLDDIEIVRGIKKRDTSERYFYFTYTLSPQTSANSFSHVYFALFRFNKEPYILDYRTRIASPDRSLENDIIKVKGKRLPLAGNFVNLEALRHADPEIADFLVQRANHLFDLKLMSPAEMEQLSAIDIRVDGKTKSLQWFWVPAHSGKSTLP
ncbi:MAG: hypothetical protein LBU53_09070 [Zoogloeaceae bacterium]|jgi:hypothetical protein|nr:hypothetical protein [Zoogloeaceae bacterium]